MKYIRTKDRVFEYNSKEQICKDGKHIFIANLSDPNYLSIREYAYFEKDVLKTTDTIEELCDEVCYVEKGRYEPSRTFPPWFNIKQINEISVALGNVERYELDNFYYGIWTDKGLIYVAKMNEKGELELL